MAYWLFKALFSPFLYVIWRVKARNRRFIPREGGVLLAANHQAFCDSLFLPLVVIRRKVAFLAKAEYFDD